MLKGIGLEVLITAFAVFLLSSCRAKEYKISIIPSEEGIRTEIAQCVYKPGESVSIRVESTDDYSIILKNISKKDEYVLKEATNELNWKVDDLVSSYAVGVYVRKGNLAPIYTTCFRVASDSDLTTYEIDKGCFNGLNVYKLDGGMSAEYAVQKSISSLTGNISHTWNIGQGGGPSPVWGAPDFLERSLQYTVDLYNRELGKDTPVETVIISTGVPLIPYLSASLGAPVLPLHFLASVNTCKEIQTILNYSCSKGYKTYATLGYDASMAEVGVAWIKMLELPEEYLRFITDHQVKNVLIAGVGEKVHAESYARRIRNHSDEEEYGVGAFYLQYTNHGSEEDMAAITVNILDYGCQQLDSVQMIADWESGILDKQIEAFSKQLGQFYVNCYALTAPESMINMYDLAGDVALAYIQKNRTVLSGVAGFVFNEYLISEPLYEFINGQVPLLYWQFTPTPQTVSRLDGYLADAVKEVFPGINMNELSIHLNARIGKKDLAEILKQKGYHRVTMRTDDVEEVWDLSDGLNAPCEITANHIINKIGLESYRDIARRLSPLTISEVSVLMQRINGVSFKSIPHDKGI